MRKLRHGDGGQDHAPASEGAACSPWAGPHQLCPRPQKLDPISGFGKASGPVLCLGSQLLGLQQRGLSCAVSQPPAPPKGKTAPIRPSRADGDPGHTWEEFQEPPRKDARGWAASALGRESSETLAIHLSGF